MRSNPSEFEFVAPKSLGAALRLLAESNREWLLVAGGTDVMVQFAAGALGSRKLLSIWNLPELRRIDVLPGEAHIGAGCTYTDLREDVTVAEEFPLLAQAASWTGGIANQNRGTLGGNIVNASPAADSLPVLLVYDADLILVSTRGEHRVPYRDFHTGYKQMNLAADELIRAVCLAKRYSKYVSYARKVGARSAQAISKVCIAALGRVEKGAIEDVRIALGSVAPTPIRLAETERLLRGKRLDAAAVTLAQKMAAEEIRPISDIRSTAEYRAAVVKNLVAEFLEKLLQSTILVRWNGLPPGEAENEILACCGSRVWARRIAARRPIATEAELLAVSHEISQSLNGADWIDAFRSHPRIGESQAQNPTAEGRSATWSVQEQSGVSGASDAVKVELATANREYEKRFGRMFIICATGKNPAEILQILRRRLQNDAETELLESAEQQRLITNIRLKKWLAT